MFQNAGSACEGGLIHRKCFQHNFHFYVRKLAPIIGCGEHACAYYTTGECSGFVLNAIPYWFTEKSEPVP